MSRITIRMQLRKALLDKEAVIWALLCQDWIVDPLFPLVWRLDKEVAGSGSHGDLVAHLIDMAHFLIGRMEEVIGMSETFIKKRPLPESMTGLRC